MNKPSRLMPSKNVLLLAGVLVLGVAARFYGERTYSSAANFDFKAPREMSDAVTWAKICLAALAGSFFGAALGHRLNRATAAIMGLVGGAVATAQSSAILGGLLGAPMSLLVAWLGPRRMAVGALACLVTVAAGVGDGLVAGTLSLGPVEPVTLLATMLLVAGVVAAVNVCVAKWYPFGAEVKTWRRVAGRVTLATATLSVAVFGVPLGITLESVLWVRNAGGSGHNPWFVRPLDDASFTRGFCDLWQWRPSPDFHERDLRKLRRFDRISGYFLDSTEIGDESLKLFGAWPGLLHLELSKTRVTDKGVGELAAVRFLGYLDLSGTRVTGDCFARLPAGLSALELADTAVTDASLAHLAKLPLRWRLGLSNTAIGDAGVANLRGLRMLGDLDLSGTRISDAALATLAKNQPLSWRLGFSNTAIGDAGVANLRGLRMLSHLDLSGTRITDAALATLAKNQTSLGRLELRDTKITPAGLAHLARLARLGVLDLSNCAITDAAIDDLVRCRLLTSLRLTGTRVTAEGIARLRAALSNCMVEYP